MEGLLKELQVVSRACVLGSHDEVCGILGFTDRYSRMIRQGKRLTKDTTENRELLKKMILEYRKIYRREQQKIEELGNA